MPETDTVILSSTWAEHPVPDKVLDQQFCFHGPPLDYLQLCGKMFPRKNQNYAYFQLLLVLSQMFSLGLVLMYGVPRLIIE